MHNLNNPIAAVQSQICRKYNEYVEYKQLEYLLDHQCPNWSNWNCKYGEVFELGKKGKTFSKDPTEIKLLVEQFCNTYHVEQMTDDNARQIINSGYAIDVVRTKKRSDGQGAFKCLFCPLLGQMNKSFKSKQGLLLHNSIHLRFSKSVNCHVNRKFGPLFHK